MEKSVKTVEPVQIPNQHGEETGLYAVVSPQMTGLPASERKRLVAGLKAVNFEEDGIEVGGTYWEAESKGDKLTGVLVGFTTLSKKDPATGELIELAAVMLDTEDGLKYHSGTQIIGACKVAPMYSAVQIEYKGKNATNKNMKDYRVTVVPPKS